MTVGTRRFTVVVDENWCKGCEICVAFCPKNVLTMNRDKAKVENPDACTGCQLCEIYCPDFAIAVNRTEDRTS